MVLHPTEVLWVPDTMKLSHWSLDLSRAENILGLSMGCKVPVMSDPTMPRHEVRAQYGRTRRREDRWFTQELMGSFVNEPADQSHKEKNIYGRRKRTFPDPSDGCPPNITESIVLLASDDACGSCPFSLRCLRGQALGVDIVHGPSGSMTTAPLLDFFVYRCPRCHCISFGISQTSPNMEFNGVMYVCPHLRHGKWPRTTLTPSDPFGAEDVPQAYAYVEFALYLSTTQHTRATSIPNGCTTECDNDKLKGYNPDHPLNRARKIKRQWPGYGSNQEWDEMDCMTVLAAKFQGPVTFR
ncbi:MAG: hypothetical protein ACYTEQ_15610 [Planctomycetota bacterium]|jgi:hypothetical protein